MNTSNPSARGPAGKNSGAGMNATNPEDVAATHAMSESASLESTTDFKSDFGQLAAENAQLAARVQQAETEILREKAEAENFRKRMRRDFDDQLRFAPLELLKDLLPAVDNLERAVSAAETSQSGAGLLDGVKMVVEQILGVLAKHRCQRIQAACQPFDPHRHDAIGQAPHDTVPAGNVAHVAQSGYQFEDRVVRPALVIVSTGKSGS